MGIRCTPTTALGVGLLAVASCANPVPPPEPERQALATFSGVVDVARGTLSITLERAAGLTTLAVEQDGLPGLASDNRVELVTESVGPCNGVDTFGGQVRIHSSYLSVANLVAQITSVTPPTGYGPNAALNESYGGLSNAWGLWHYEGGPGTAELWCFDAPAAGRFDFRGRVWGDPTLVPAPDGGVPADSGVPVDSGVPADSGLPVDSGVFPDSGVLPDGGAPDAGPRPMENVSVSTLGAAGNGASQAGRMSFDGLRVVFSTAATNLGPNGAGVLGRERAVPQTSHWSWDPSELPVNGNNPDISDDGRTILFHAGAGPFLFVRDTIGGVTRAIGTNSSGVQIGISPRSARLSRDGRYAVYYTENYAGDGLPRLVRVNLATLTRQAFIIGTNGSAGEVSVSASGRYAAFESLASDIVGGDTNGVRDVFRYDFDAGAAVRVSVATGGAEGNGPSRWPSISSDGLRVAFSSQATNLVGGDTNGSFDVFVRDLSTGTTVRASVSSAGLQGNGPSGWSGPAPVSLSSSGRYVAFSSGVTNFGAGGGEHIYVRDLLLGTTLAIGSPGGSAARPFFSGDEVYVGFQDVNCPASPCSGLGDVWVAPRP